MFEAAKLPLIRFENKRSYVLGEVREKLEKIIEINEQLVIEQTYESEKRQTENKEVHLCPKCNIPMVKRVATKGDRKGQEFYGCSNYPKCRETI